MVEGKYKTLHHDLLKQSSSIVLGDIHDPAHSALNYLPPDTETNVIPHVFERKLLYWGPKQYITIRIFQYRLEL